MHVHVNPAAKLMHNLCLLRAQIDKRLYLLSQEAAVYQIDYDHALFIRNIKVT